MAEIRNINALRADRENDNTLLSPADCLQDAAEDIRLGNLQCDGLLLIALDRTNGGFSFRYRCSNMRTSEIVALLEVMKAKALSYMQPSEE